MEVNKKGIVSSLEYSIQYLAAIKKDLLQLTDKDRGTAWALSGFVVALVANLLRIIDDVMSQPLEGRDATQDLANIQASFNALIEQMRDGK